MKKIFIALLIAILLTGCTMINKENQNSVSEPFSYIEDETHFLFNSSEAAIQIIHEGETIKRIAFKKDLPTIKMANDVYEEFLKSIKNNSPDAITIDRVELINSSVIIYLNKEAWGSVTFSQYKERFN